MTAYVTQSGYRANDDTPRLHKTTDAGLTWTSLQGDLPQLAINDLAIHPTSENVLFVATDGGVYGSIDAGVHWERVWDNMPVVPVFDVAIDMNTNRLLAGTFARSLYSVSLDSLLTTVGISPWTQANPLLISPNPATDYVKLDVPASFQKDACINILDMQGNILRQSPFQTQIPVNQLAKGMYLMTVESGSKRWTGRFLKQ